jgi:hypothetical protein
MSVPWWVVHITIILLFTIVLKVRLLDCSHNLQTKKHGSEKANFPKQILGLRQGSCVPKKALCTCSFSIHLLTYWEEKVL